MMTEPGEPEVAPVEWTEDDLKGNDIHPPVYLPEGEPEDGQ
jgi:hypothetical protein